MNTRLTLFTATLVQDSALSVSGVDREGTADRPFTVVDGIPVLSGRGLKGAAVAMARRFFDPLPRAVSEDADRKTALRRSAWEFSNATPATVSGVLPRLRAGVGIRQDTCARASRVLYDHEVMPAGTRWPLLFRVDWSWAGAEAEEAEGILGYILSQHWVQGRCWLGGSVARGLGWCHLEELQAYRLHEQAYEVWVSSGRKTLPKPLQHIPAGEPTRSWCFRTLKVQVDFGEYRPDETDEAGWGLDMLAIGSHSADRTSQSIGSGTWVWPSWADANAAREDGLTTDRAILMEQGRPLLPGASVRGPMRHAFSHTVRGQGRLVTDPHPVRGDVGDNDEAGTVFGTITRSSRVLICDAHANDGWAAARLHMHAEDEFSAGSYLSAKRDTVRLLRGTFPVRIVVEGPDPAIVEPLTAQVDHLVALGALRHLPIGGQKTRGAGWGRWTTGGWDKDDVVKARNWAPEQQKDSSAAGKTLSSQRSRTQSAWAQWRSHELETAWIRVKTGTLDKSDFTLGTAATLARKLICDGHGGLVAWWCEPTIDFAVTAAPEIFGWAWPDDRSLSVDEVVFFMDQGSWRAARTAAGIRWVLVEEVDSQSGGAEAVEVLRTPARLHGDTTRFAARFAERGRLIVREWRSKGTIIGFTLAKEVH